MPDKNYKAHAPYNFVKLSSRVIKRYEKYDDLPDHSKYKDDLINGTIEYEIENETPLMIAGGKLNTNENTDANNTKEFFKNFNGKCTIPGNTIRGLVRSNLSILGMTTVSDSIDDSIFLYRTFAKTDKIAKEYKIRVGMDSKPSESGKPYSIVEKVHAGYIKKVSKDEYVIIPAQKKGNDKDYFRVSEDSLIAKKINLNGMKFISDGRENFNPYCIKVNFELNENNMSIKTISNTSQKGLSGYLLCSGFMDKKKSHYIINEEDKKADKINIDKSEIDAYEEDLIRKKMQNNRYYSLPVNINESKPIFYVKENVKDKDRLYFGFTPFLRILYDNSIFMGIPNDLKDETILDYGRAIFGFANIEFSLDEKKSYKSRVSFEDAEIINSPSSKVYEMVLGEPKPTCFTNYIEQPDGNDANKLKSYNDDDFKIRGIKQYWIQKNINPAKAATNDRVNVKINALTEGGKFRGKINFNNLSQDELGLLLWSIKLNDDSIQNIGMGKPYGFGRIKVNVNKLEIEDIKNKYASIKSEYKKLDEVDKYINIYKKYLEEKYKINIDEQTSVKELFFIKSKIMEGYDVSYMQIKDKNLVKEFAIRVPLNSISQYSNGKLINQENAINSKISNISKDNKTSYNKNYNEKKNYSKNNFSRNNNKNNTREKTVMEIAMEKANNKKK